MDFHVNDSGAGILKLEGELTVQCAGLLKELLLTAFEQVETITLDIESADTIDVSCLQLLCSAHRTFIKSNKDMNAAGIMNPSFQKTIHDAGFIRKGGCLFNPNGRCLWISGGES